LRTRCSLGMATTATWAADDHHDAAEEHPHGDHRERDDATAVRGGPRTRQALRSRDCVARRSRHGRSRRRSRPRLSAPAGERHLERSSGWTARCDRGAGPPAAGRRRTADDPDVRDDAELVRRRTCRGEADRSEGEPLAERDAVHDVPPPAVGDLRGDQPGPEAPGTRSSADYEWHDLLPLRSTGTAIGHQSGHGAWTQAGPGSEPGAAGG
jgi:hypothetical protein